MNNDLLTQFIDDLRQRPRYYIAWVVGIILSILLLWNIFLYLTTGTLKVETGKDNRVTVRSVGGKSWSKDYNGPTKARLKPGSYVVSVANKYGIIKQKFDIKARGSVSYTLNPEPIKSIEPVMPAGAYSLISGSGRTYYLNYTDSKLYEIKESGIPTLVKNSPNFYGSIEWQGPGYGVGRSNLTNQLYSITDGLIEGISLPFTNSTNLYFSLAANKTLFVSDGNNLYKKEMGKDFTKVKLSFDGMIGIGGVSAGDSSVILSPRAPESQSEEEEHGSSVFIIKYDGSLIAKSSEISAYESEWSPDGKHIVVSSDSSTTIYDQELKVTQKIPETNVVAISWIDNDNIAYASGQSIFTYQISQDNIRHLTDSPIGSGVSGIFANENSKQVYLEIERNTSSSTERELGRVNVDSKEVPKYLYGLDAFFPATYRSCDFSYFNFTQPVITFSNNNPNTDCIAMAKLELKQDNLPVEAFSILPAPVIQQIGE